MIMAFYIHSTGRSSGCRECGDKIPGDAIKLHFRDLAIGSNKSLCISCLITLMIRAGIDFTDLLSDVWVQKRWSR